LQGNACAPRERFGSSIYGITDAARTVFVAPVRDMGDAAPSSIALDVPVVGLCIRVAQQFKTAPPFTLALDIVRAAAPRASPHRG